MVKIRDHVIHTQQFSTVAYFAPVAGSVYISGTSVEHRSSHIATWRSGASDVEFFATTPNADRSFVLDSAEIQLTIRTRSSADLERLSNHVGDRQVYLDITGLAHHIWAPILRQLAKHRTRTKLVYVEPARYSRSLTPTEGEIFDLSEKISGIEPIPGFASLLHAKEEFTCFVPLLGFEGTRFAFMLEHIQPPGGKVFPVIGVPGFTPEYPYFTYLGNKNALLESKSWPDVRFAPANCVYSLYYLLESIAENNPEHVIKISPIGTKPHAVGAILFCIAYPDRAEIIYDHPIRKSSRTDGTARLLVYDLNPLFA